MRQDDSFRYQFASGAGCYSPPVFYDIYKGQLIDVSDQPGFRRQWESFAAQTGRLAPIRRMMIVTVGAPLTWLRVPDLAATSRA